MKNENFKISTKIVWFLVIANTLLTVIGTLAKINDWNFPEFLLTFGLMMLFSSWVIILNDMVKHNIYNKTFWIISMFIIPNVSSIFYLIQRNRLLRLGQFKNPD